MTAKGSRAKDGPAVWLWRLDRPMRDLGLCRPPGFMIGDKAANELGKKRVGVFIARGRGYFPERFPFFLGRRYPASFPWNWGFGTSRGMGKCATHKLRSGLSY